MFNGTNSDHLYLRIATVSGTLFRHLIPPYEYMSTHGNTAKLGTVHRNIQTAQSSPSLVGIESTLNYLILFSILTAVN